MDPVRSGSMRIGNVDIPSLVDRVLTEIALPWHGPHGLLHWGRVLENGMKLAPQTGADLEVVALFALLHDARRHNDSGDPKHGWRGAGLAKALRGECFELDDARMRLLMRACADHSAGGTDRDVTVATCFDADRLDLLRVGTRPHPARLCTEAARDPELLAWANARAEAWEVPDCVRGVHDALMAELRRNEV